MDGEKLRDEVVARLRKEIEAKGSPKVCLATLLVGDDKPSKIYVRWKHKKAEEAGMVSKGIELPGSATQEEVEAAVKSFADDPDVHGILVQLPIPDHLDTERVLDLVPCTPLGVMRLLERYGIPTKGKRAVVIGRSTLVGLPQTILLIRKGGDATTTCAHSHTQDLVAVCREADIIVSAVGIAKLITKEHVKPGAVVVDVGVSRVETKIVGDVDFDEVQKVASAITPMPGGTGPMTIACLLENTLEAAKMQGKF